MLRQIRNFRKLGRIRTSPRSPRTRKPLFLKQHPELEIGNFLEIVAHFVAIPADGFYFIQIGAFDGISDDPLQTIIRKSPWQGVLVEPQPGAFASRSKLYKGNKALKLFNVAIGPEDGELTLYTPKGGDVAIASTNPDFLVKPGHSRSELIAQTVPCWSFERLLNEAGAPARIDLLQLDTEGFDFEIIKPIDFSAIKPEIIRYEHVLLSENDKNACLKHLADQGYRFVLEDMDTTAVLQTEDQ